MDQVAMAVATALVAKGAETLADAGRSAVGALVRLVRRRFGSGTQEVAVLDEAVAHPADRERLIALAEVLARLMAADRLFRHQIEACWREAAPELAADHGGVINQFSGSADKVVQARDIYGDVTF
ncbi:MAG TPA: hypothetical protein VFM55_01780 [Micromonosporaceae bacterium]|nr:hypothetical protein [Micromonosporaceae bacterium]